MANGRKLPDWLRGYLEYTRNQESPSMFHLWTGVSTIAATLERKVFIDRGYYKLHPNIYIVLVGASARVRKSTAIGIASNIYKEAFPDASMFAQKITPEALIGMLKENFTVKGVSAGYIISDELSVFLGNSAKDTSLIALLTKLYDCGDKFDYHTIVRGKELCEKPCCNMLAGTTPDWIRLALPIESIGGGFTSRIIFVYQDMPGPPNPFPELSEAERKLRANLILDLQNIGQMGGQFSISHDAKEMYEDWYVDLFKPEEASDGALDGYYGRKHDTLLKISMIMSASRNNIPIIEEKDIETALSAMNENEKRLPETMRLIQSTSIGDDNVRVLRAIARRGVVGHSELLRSLSYCLDAKKLNEIIDSLTASDQVEEEVQNNKRSYRIKTSKFRK